MAWLKFDVTTPEKPEVLAITISMGWEDPDLTVGKLLKVWRWFDQHTVSGNAPNVTAALFDRLIGVTGLSKAMADVGWLEISESGLSLPNFETHNGKTAKDRALTASRVANHKATAKGNAASVSDALPREEKRREEKKEDKQPTVVKRASKKCPADFEVSEDMRTWASLECPTVDATKATAKFRDHTFKNSITDWTGAWRNWLRRDAESAPGFGRVVGINKQEALEASNAAVAERFLRNNGYATQ